MIARIWRGATRAEDADRYLWYLHRTGLPDYREDDRFLVEKHPTVEHHQVLAAVMAGRTTR